jgi:hypothetical protein
MFRVLWRAYKVTGQTYGLIFFVYQFISALFGNNIETPQAGIVIYLIAGLALGPMFDQLDRGPELDLRDSHDDLDPHAPDPTFPEMVHARGN